jgi:hypothetical protein
MALLRVSITRYVSDDPQPGLVECELIDRHGRRWSFVEKTAVVSDEVLGPETTYPRPGVIAGEVIGRFRDAQGREVVRVDTGRPWGVVTLDGVSQFEVFAEDLAPG